MSYQKRKGKRIKALTVHGKEPSGHVRGKPGLEKHCGKNPAFAQQLTQTTPVRHPEKESRVEGEPRQSSSGKLLQELIAQQRELSFSHAFHVCSAASFE